MKRSILYFAALSVLFTAGGCQKDNSSSLLAQIDYRLSAVNTSASVGTGATGSGKVVAPGSRGSVEWAAATCTAFKTEMQATYTLSGTSFSKDLSRDLGGFFNIDLFKIGEIAGKTEVPVGDYTNMKLKLTTIESPSNFPLYMRGTYWDNTGTPFPVILYLNNNQDFNKDMGAIEISSGSYLSTVVVSLNTLVTNVSTTDFDNATRSGSNNTIIISTATNKALYDKFSARFIDCLSVNIVKQ